MWLLAFAGLRHAIAAFPTVRFIAKGDDDVWLHLHGIAALLSAIPQALTPVAYVGSFVFSNLVMTAKGRYKSLGTAPDFANAMRVRRLYGMRQGCARLRTRVAVIVQRCIDFTPSVSVR